MMDAHCPRCGRQNRRDARFCDGCGAALHEAIGASVAPAPSPSSDAALCIGRERELATIDKLLARAQGGAGAIVSIAGEPGIGKSHTAQVVAQRAAARGMQVFWGRCNEEPGAPPYRPWLQLMQGWLAAHDDLIVARVL